MPVTMKVSILFFDSPRVMREMDRATRRALGKSGAFVRRRARTSIRKGKGVSRPGQPPKSHAGDIRRLLFFSLGPDRQSVVIGPQRYKEGEAPNLLEFGGTAVRQRIDRKTGKLGRKKVVVYRKRPFMGPALEAELPGVPDKWRNSIGGNL